MLLMVVLMLCCLGQQAWAVTASGGIASLSAGGNLGDVTASGPSYTNQGFNTEYLVNPASGKYGILTLSTTGFAGTLSAGNQTVTGTVPADWTKGMGVMVPGAGNPCNISGSGGSGCPTPMAAPTINVVHKLTMMPRSSGVTITGLPFTEILTPTPAFDGTTKTFTASITNTCQVNTLQLRIATPTGAVMPVYGTGGVLYGGTRLPGVSGTYDCTAKTISITYPVAPPAAATGFWATYEQPLGVGNWAGDVMVRRHDDGAYFHVTTGAPVGAQYKVTDNGNGTGTYTFVGNQFVVVDIYYKLLTPPPAATFHDNTNAANATVAKLDSAGVGVLPAVRADQLYVVGNLITDSNGNVQICTIGGTTTGAHPVWATTVGTTTSDTGGVVWTLATIISNSAHIETATAATTSAHGFAVGDSVTLSGVTTPGYDYGGTFYWNGTYTVLTTPTSTTFTFIVNANLPTVYNQWYVKTVPLDGTGHGSPAASPAASITNTEFAVAASWGPTLTYTVAPVTGAYAYTYFCSLDNSTYYLCGGTFAVDTKYPLLPTMWMDQGGGTWNADDLPNNPPTTPQNETLITTIDSLTTGVSGSVVLHDVPQTGTLTSATLWPDDTVVMTAAIRDCTSNGRGCKFQLPLTPGSAGGGLPKGIRFQQLVTSATNHANSWVHMVGAGLLQSRLIPWGDGGGSCNFNGANGQIIWKDHLVNEGFVINSTSSLADCTVNISAGFFQEFDFRHVGFEPLINYNRTTAVYLRLVSGDFNYSEWLNNNQNIYIHDNFDDGNIHFGGMFQAWPGMAQHPAVSYDGAMMHFTIDDGVVIESIWSFIGPGDISGIDPSKGNAYVLNGFLMENNYASDYSCQCGKGLFANGSGGNRQGAPGNMALVSIGGFNIRIANNLWYDSGEVGIIPGLGAIFINSNGVTAYPTAQIENIKASGVAYGVISSQRVRITDWVQQGMPNGGIAISVIGGGHTILNPVVTFGSNPVGGQIGVAVNYILDGVGCNTFAAAGLAYFGKTEYMSTDFQNPSGNLIYENCNPLLNPEELHVDGVLQSMINGTPSTGHCASWTSASVLGDSGGACGAAGASLSSYLYLPSAVTSQPFGTANSTQCTEFTFPGNVSSGNAVIEIATNDPTATNFYDVGVTNSSGTVLADFGSATQGIPLTAGATCTAPCAYTHAWNLAGSPVTVSFTAGTQYFMCWTGMSTVGHIDGSINVLGLGGAVTSSAGKLANMTPTVTYARRNTPEVLFIP